MLDTLDLFVLVEVAKSHPYQHKPQNEYSSRAILKNCVLKILLTIYVSFMIHSVLLWKHTRTNSSYNSTTRSIKKLNPFKFKLAITYCSNFTALTASS